MWDKYTEYPDILLYLLNKTEFRAKKDKKEEIFYVIQHISQKYCLSLHRK